MSTQDSNSQFHVKDIEFFLKYLNFDYPANITRGPHYISVTYKHNISLKNSTEKKKNINSKF
jgi:hypothetical protein